MTTAYIGAAPLRMGIAVGCLVAVTAGCWCSLHASPGEPQDQRPVAPSVATGARPSARALAPIPDGHGGWYAVLAATGMVEEASNAGGEHVTLQVIERAPGMPHWLHLGGHAKHLELRCVDRFVAHIRRVEPSRVWDGGWALGSLPAYDGAIDAIASASRADLADALARAARTGLIDGSPIASGRWPRLMELDCALQCGDVE
jgi:hypothetical protein